MLARAKGTSSLPLSRSSHSFFSHPAILNNLAHIFEQISRSPSPWRHLRLGLTFQTRDAREWPKSYFFQRHKTKKTVKGVAGMQAQSTLTVFAVQCHACRVSNYLRKAGTYKKSFCATNALGFACFPNKM